MRDASCFQPSATLTDLAIDFGIEDDRLERRCGALERKAANDDGRGDGFNPYTERGIAARRRGAATTNAKRAKASA